MATKAKSAHTLKTKHFYFQRIDGTALLQDSYALRFQVYCQERNFLPSDNYKNHTEIDLYDDSSLHFAAFDRSDRMVGTVRLVRSSTEKFPVLEHCSIDSKVKPSELTPGNTAEISRLAVSKLFRRRANDGLYGLSSGIEKDPLGRREKPEIVFGLYKIMYQESKRQGIRFWYAAMEQTLERLLARYSFVFEKIGPETDYYGPVTPYCADIKQMEERVRSERPDIFSEFTEGLDPALIPNEPSEDKTQQSALSKHKP